MQTRVNIRSLWQHKITCIHKARERETHQNRAHIDHGVQIFMLSGAIFQPSAHKGPSKIKTLPRRVEQVARHEWILRRSTIKERRCLTAKSKDCSKSKAVFTLTHAHTGTQTHHHHSLFLPFSRLYTPTPACRSSDRRFFLTDSAGPTTHSTPHTTRSHADAVSRQERMCIRMSSGCQVRQIHRR